MDVNRLISQYDPGQIQNQIETDGRITPSSELPPSTTHTIQNTPINSASIIAVSDHIVESNKQKIFQYKQLLDMAREKIALMQKDGVPLNEIQNFISAVYASQLKAVFAIALKEMGKECPIGDRWAVLGLGSLGRGNVNPYSDLDFAIAVEEHTPEVEDFFKELLTHVNRLVDEYHDAGLFLCKGHITPPYFSESEGYVKTDGSKELFGKPEALAQYTLSTIRNSGMALDMKANSLLDANLLFGNETVSNKFVETLQTDFSQIDPKNSEQTNYKSTGLMILVSGTTFWKNLDQIDNLNFNKDNPPKGLLTNPCCNIKDAVIRPIQNGILGLSLYYGIREPNTLKALDQLIEGKHIDKNLGKKLKEAYEFVSFLRIRIELEKKTENTEVTCCPLNLSFLARQKDALVISSDEKEQMFEIEKTMTSLRDHLNQIISH